MAKPNYSMRAFSRDLDLSPSFLSDLLQGKKKVSIDRAMGISQKLGWSWRESQVFLQTAQLAQAKSARARRFIRKELDDSISHLGSFKALKLGQFSLISSWYYLAIIELSEIPHFSIEPKWIAKRLGIDLNMATSAIALLLSKQFIILSPEGQWVKNINASVKDSPSIEIQKFHRQHLLNAMEALEKQKFHNRHFSGVTMAVNPEKMPEALNLIREFRARMNALLESGPKEKVYHLAIQLFQLDQEN
jgi:uncharacterized protein (TIGR02147 family)